jgi:thioredoxin reductase
MALFSSVSLIAQAASPAPQTQEGGQPQHHHEMPKPTNLKVLPKDISSADLMSTMHGYTKALGVECSFCHAEDPELHRMNFASDAKPDKDIARTMIAMTEEINAKYLATIKDPDATTADKTVTCGTCHRGNTMPTQFTGTGDGHEAHHDMPAKSE